MRRIWLLFLAWALMCSLTGPAQAAPHKLLIVVLDKVSWPDLVAHEAEAPTLWEVARQGSAGAMCVRTASDDGGGAYLTLGAGSRAAAEITTRLPLGTEGLAFNANEVVGGRKAGVAYGALTGEKPGRDRIVHLGVGDLDWQNSTPSYPLRVGLLGEALRAAGLHVACLGNSDSARGPHRAAVALAMDRQGRVELGDVSAKFQIPDSNLPAGCRLATGRLAAAFSRLAPRADLVVVDLGETSRAAEFQSVVPPARAEVVFAKALARADRALAALLATVSPDEWGVLVLVPSLPTPGPGRPAATLAPIFWRVPGLGGGLLTSPSTRRAGFVTSADVAAGVLTYFGLAVPPASVGRAPRSLPSDYAPETLQQDLARHESVEAARRPMFSAFPILATVVLSLCIFAILLGERFPRGLRALLRGLLLICLALPSASLLATQWPDPVPSGMLLPATFALTAALALVAGLVTRGRAADGMLALLIAALLSLDLVLGESMLRWATLSYSISSGARFYGIGNELAGALMGATLVALAALLSGRTRIPVSLRLTVTLLLVLLVALVASPEAGANFGMALSCAVAFTVFGLYVWRGRLRWVDLLLVAFVAVAVGAAVVIADSLSGHPSHIGLLAGAARAEGPGPVWAAIARKLSMSWRLVVASTWSSVALTAMILLVGTVVFRPPLLLDALRRRPWLLPGLISLVAGALAAVLLNDSGILAAALALLYGAGSLAYLGLGKTGPLHHSSRVVPVESKGTVRVD